MYVVDVLPMVDRGNETPWTGRCHLRARLIRSGWSVIGGPMKWKIFVRIEFL